MVQVVISERIVLERRSGNRQSAHERIPWRWLVVLIGSFTQPWVHYWFRIVRLYFFGLSTYFCLLEDQSFCKSNWDIFVFGIGEINLIASFIQLNIFFNLRVWVLRIFSLHLFGKSIIVFGENFCSKSFKKHCWFLLLNTAGSFGWTKSAHHVFTRRLTVQVVKVIFNFLVLIFLKNRAAVVVPGHKPWIVELVHHTAHVQILVFDHECFFSVLSVRLLIC